MKLHLISSVVLLAIIAIETLEASPSPIRFVTPKPGIDYTIRTVTPNSRIRYLRSIEDDESSEEAKRLLEPSGVTQSTIVKRSPERIVINYKPPPQNGPRYARAVGGCCD